MSYVSNQPLLGFRDVKSASDARSSFDIIRILERSRMDIPSSPPCRLSLRLSTYSSTKTLYDSEDEICATRGRDHEDPRRWEVYKDRFTLLRVSANPNTAPGAFILVPLYQQHVHVLRDALLSLEHNDILPLANAYISVRNVP